MKVLGIRHLTKLKKKNKGNSKLVKAIDLLLKDIAASRWKNKEEVIATRADADCVNSEGFYFFDMNLHRSFILIEYQPHNAVGDEDDLGIATIHWVGSHKEYESIFKNNKKTIDKWLRNKGLIE